MAKLTLSVDPKVIKQAKRYAAARKTSVSRVVEQYLKALTRPSSKEGEIPPTLAKIRAELRGVTVDEEDYYRYLERKYL